MVKTCAFVVEVDACAVVEEHVRLVIQGVVFAEQVFHRLGEPFLAYQEFGVQEGNLPVVLIADGVANAVRLIQVVMEHLLPCEEDLWVDAVWVQAHGKFYRLVSLALVAVRHVVFGNVGQFVGIHVYGAAFVPCLDIALQQSLELRLAEV